MNVLVTGGTGSVGKEVVRRLSDHGNKVTVIGRRSGVEIAGCVYKQCDITDTDSLRRMMAEIEIVVHLAAIPNPHSSTAEELFHVNCQGTFNVFSAAAACGIKRVICASSINALGSTFGIREFVPVQFPIDETHPCYTTDPYSFSKNVMEETAAYFWRRDGISSVCLRLPAVADLSVSRWGWADHPAEEKLRAYRELMEMPQQSRRAMVNEMIEMRNARHRRTEAQSQHQKHDHHKRQDWKKWWSMPLDALRMLHLLGSGRTDFWAIVDKRDAAQAVEKSITASYEGCHPIFINDCKNSAGVDTEILIDLFFPNVTRRIKPICNDEALVSFERARRLIGFEPEYHAMPIMDRDSIRPITPVQVSEKGPASTEVQSAGLDT